MRSRSVQENVSEDPGPARKGIPEAPKALKGDKLRVMDSSEYDNPGYSSVGLAPSSERAATLLEMPHVLGRRTGSKVNMIGRVGRDVHQKHAARAGFLYRLL